MPQSVERRIGEFRPGRSLRLPQPCVELAAFAEAEHLLLSPVQTSRVVGHLDDEERRQVDAARVAVLGLRQVGEGFGQGEPVAGQRQPLVEPGPGVKQEREEGAELGVDPGRGGQEPERLLRVKPVDALPPAPALRAPDLEIDPCMFQDSGDRRVDVPVARRRRCCRVERSGGFIDRLLSDAGQGHADEVGYDAAGPDLPMRIEAPEVSFVAAGLDVGERGFLECRLAPGYRLRKATTFDLTLDGGDDLLRGQGYIEGEL